MKTDALDRRLLAEIADGLPLAPAPYAVIGARVGIGEADVIARLKAMIGRGVIRRFGAVVHHHELGFTANAMTVWDIPDARSMPSARKSPPIRSLPCAISARAARRNGRTISFA